MSDRSPLSTQAALWIWVVAVVGSLVMAVAVVGAFNGLFCGDPDVPELSGAGGFGTTGWVILVIGAVVPVMIMAGIAPARRRRVLVTVAVVVAVLELLILNLSLGECLVLAHVGRAPVGARPTITWLFGQGLIARGPLPLGPTR